MALHRVCVFCGSSMGRHYDPLLAQFDRAVEAGFLKPEGRALVVADDDAGRLLDLLAEAAPAPDAKWIRTVEQT